MLSRVRRVLVDDLAAIDAIGEDAIEMAAAQGPAAAGSAVRAGVALGAMAFGMQGRHQLHDRSELRITAEYMLHQFRFALIDHELALPGVIAKGRGAAHPQALLLGGGDLVADALTRDLALELGEGQQHVQHEATHRGRGVELLGDRDEGHAMRVEQLDQLGEVGERAGQAVDLVDDHDLDLAGADVHQEALQRRSVQCTAGIAAVVVMGRQQPPAFVLLALDVGRAGLALGVEGVELLLQTFLGGLAGIDRAPADRLLRSHRQNPADALPLDCRSPKKAGPFQRVPVMRDVHDLTVMRSDWWPWLQSMPWFDEKRNVADLYPVVMEKLLGVKEKRREFLAHMIRPTEMAPTKGYEALANLLHEGLVTTVLTTNFDARIEEAQIRLSRPHALTVMRTPDDLIQFTTAPRAPQLLYLHGSVDHYSDKNLTSEVERIDRAVVMKLIPVLRDHPIVVVGYRGSEASIMIGLFQDLVKETSAFLRGVYWCARGETRLDQLHPMVQTFARTIGSNFQIIPIRGFDELLSEDLWPTLATAVRKRKGVSPTEPIHEGPFDMRADPNLTVEDLDQLLLLARLTQYAHQLGVGAPDEPDNTWAFGQARERHLTADANGRPCATYAGWLLFARRPQAAMRHARIEFTARGPETWVKEVYGEENASTSNGERDGVAVNRSISGHLWAQLYTSLDLLALVNAGFRLKEVQSRLAYPYDAQALKEIVVNALVHRDYERDEPVQIEVTSDSIRVTSPGGITSDVQDQMGDAGLEQAIRSGRRGIKGYRNPVISDLFYGGQEMDRRGSGLSDVLERCRANGGDVRFGPTTNNTHFVVEIFPRPEAVDAVTRTAIAAGREQVRFAANLLTVVKMPRTIWHVGVTDRSMETVSRTAGAVLPPAYVEGGRLFSFHDLTAFNSQLRSLGEGDIESLTLEEFLKLPAGDRALVRLLNLALAEHLESRGLIVERQRQRAYFPKEAQGERQVSYQGRIARRRARSQRLASAASLGECSIGSIRPLATSSCDSDRNGRCCSHRATFSLWTANAGYWDEIASMYSLRAGHQETTTRLSFSI